MNDHKSEKIKLENVFIIILVYEDLGCWNDKIDRAVPHILKSGIRPPHVILQCLRLAQENGYNLFALQNGIECFGGAENDTYDKYGKSDVCNSVGTGGRWANQVYTIKTKGKMV